MVLIDTSVFIEYFKGNEQAREVERLSIEDRALLHPWVLGELMLGGISDKSREVLHSLQTAVPAQIDQLYQTIEEYNLVSRGIGLVDVALIHEAVDRSNPIWSFDSKLSSLSTELALSYTPSA